MEDEMRRNRVACHRSDGFAFVPQNREKHDGDMTYGDASMTSECFQKRVSELRSRRVDRSLIHPYQIIVMLSH